MASFSYQYPHAYHVLPLHLWKLVCAAGELAPKAAHRFRRPTTAAVDTELGFDDVVHFYLASDRDKVRELPILKTQLQPSNRPPFPHLVLGLDTRELEDEECIVCNWNLAVSRPAVANLCKGGNWTRGTDPRTIRAVWDAFRELNPRASTARGYFVEGRAVPIILGYRLKRSVHLMSKAPRRMPELMVPEPVSLARLSEVVAFSEADAELARSVSKVSFDVRVESFPGYAPNLVAASVRKQISEYFVGPGVDGVPVLEYDALRPR